jgi:hypothetical protein
MPRRLITLWTCLTIGLLSSAAHAGYDQYFTWKIDPAGPRLAQCVNEMNLLIHIRRQVLQVIPPDPKLQGADAVAFNGIGADQGDPFIFPGNTLSHNMNGAVPANLVGFNACNTNWKSYDEVVVACLLVARDHFTDKELVVTSDGIWDDWGGGRKLYEDILGRTAHNPLPPPPMPVPIQMPMGRQVAIIIVGVAMLFFVKRVVRRAASKS